MAYMLLQSGTVPRSVSADLTITVLVMVVLGGVGFRWGAIVGGVLYTLLDQRLTVLAGSDAIAGLPDVLRVPLSEPLFILGVLFILVVMFLPGGIAGTADAWARRRRGERARTVARPSRRRGCRGRAHPRRGARVTWEWEFAGRSSSDGAHTIGRWLTDRAVASPERIAIDDRGVTIGYRELEDRAHELSLALRRAGYGAGDRIATVSGNSIDHVVSFFACAKAGVAFVPLSWRLTARELAGVARSGGCAARAGRGRVRGRRRRCPRPPRFR